MIFNYWKTYYGSAQEIKENLKNYPKDKFVRVILKLCKSKKELTYYESIYHKNRCTIRP